MTKPLRQSMPTVAAWIDELREVFGADGINASIKNGLAGGSDFYAEENGHALGSEAAGGREVSLADMILSKANTDALAKMSMLVGMVGGAMIENKAVDENKNE